MNRTRSLKRIPNSFFIFLIEFLSLVPVASTEDVYVPSKRVSKSTEALTKDVPGTSRAGPLELQTVPLMMCGCACPCDFTDI